MLVFANQSSITPLPNLEEDTAMAKQDISIERARTLYAYNSETGTLTYRARLSPRVNVGDPVGGKSKGYRYAKIDGVAFPLHHLIWFHQKGYWPKEDLAFRDYDQSNTKIENLVEQTKVETVQKQGLRSTNKTGVKGISLTKSGRFQVHLYGSKGGRVVGTKFKTLEAAKEALAQALASGLELKDSTDLQKAFHAVGGQSRRVWRKLNFVTGGSHDWVDPQALFAEVGFPPTRAHILAAVDLSKPLGPKNTQWVLPKEVGQKSLYEKMVPAKGADYYFNRDLLKKFGITADDYKSKLAEQNGVCAICETISIPDKSGRAYILAVDHDHETRAVRGLLCRTCNVGIGYLKDRAALLRKAADYLDHWEAKAVKAPTSNVISLKKA